MFIKYVFNFFFKLFYLFVNTKIIYDHCALGIRHK